MKAPLKILSFILLLCIFFTVSPFCVSAMQEDENEAVKLTLDDAIDMAVGYSYQIQEIEQYIDSLWETYNNQRQYWNMLQQQLEYIELYNSLYTRDKNGVELEPLERMQLEMFRAMYGLTPPQLSGIDKFNNYIKPGEFSCYQIYAQVEKARNQRSLINKTLASDIRETYNNILLMRNELAIQKNYLETYTEQNKKMHKLYENGLISQFDVYSSDTALMQQEITIGMAERNIQNMEILLKSKLGIPMDREIILESATVKNTLKLHSTYDYYLKRALSEREEILSAQIDLNNRSRELDVVKQYFTHELLTERIDAQIAADEAETAYNEAVLKVTVDIRTGYMDVVSKYNDAILALKDFNNAKKQFNSAEKQYEAGQIDFNTMLEYQASLKNSEIEYINAVYKYNNAVDRLNTASGIGPSYSVQGGLQ